MIRALLVDDEEHALRILRILLERTGEVEIVGEATNGFDALDKLKLLKPDVVFSDIEMPGLNGVELAERIGSENLDIQVVFVTAYDRYAISAFENDAVDYLLKPLEKERLIKTVQRVKKEALKNSARSEMAASLAMEEGSGSQAAERPILQVSLLGGISVVNAGKERMKWRTGKERELFAYLACRKGERVHRDTIVDALWPEEHYQKAKVYLHTCVSLLRKDLRQMGFDGALIYEGEKYHIKEEVFSTDYERFKESVQKLKSSPAVAQEALEDVLNLYQGPLFKDEDYAWAEEEILSVEQIAGELRMELAIQYEKNKEYVRMSDVIHKQLAVSPYDEEAYRLMMRAQFAAGKHEEVFRIYQLLLNRLGELGIEPSKMTVEVFNEIKRKRDRG
ncbi:response regulator [Cohnella sp. AR92]|uniref:response regulator n=1 Tax=Cohnella sp. AR92 TaxID=648716 RepID=UPI000F8CD2B0|nr:response regulator [Cohnella sp. AR92]RUS49083.1 response regulator [Cohnella sp. AR92]